MTGDDFPALFERHRRELQVHCYRMLGSLQDSEDLVQETFLRAWRARDSYEGRASLRTWLYRIATNACLDFLDKAKRRTVAVPEDGGAPVRFSEVSWLQPFPDALLDEVVDTEAGPDSQLVAKETVELAFLAAIQHLPATQRAVLILRDVLGWSAKDAAELLDTSVASANSALQRARETMQARLPARRSDWSRDAGATAEEERLLQRYVDVNERADVEAFAALLSEDVTFSMPPDPTFVAGRERLVRYLGEHGFGTPEFPQLKLVPVRANRQPGAANYCKRPGETKFRAMALDVIRFDGDGRVAEITAFPPELFAAFGLPAEL